MTDSNEYLLIEESGLFDQEWYLGRYADVALSEIHPLQHYILAGWVMERDPHPLFNARHYLAQLSPEERASSAALVHYLRKGWSQGLSPHPLFDAGWYLREYPDIAEAKIDPLQHYLYYGAYEDRDPHPCFSTSQVFGAKPELRQQRVNPLLYYVQGKWTQDPCPSATSYLASYVPGRVITLDEAVRLRSAQSPLLANRVSADAYLPSKKDHLSVPEDLSVSVVVPVYKGLEETKRCINSVLANEDPLVRVEVIAVDDYSPEPKLSEWLRGLSSEKRITLIRNEKNLGFVASVNRGMIAAGTSDVVLLNSDTEVPPGWLSRLAGHAYSSGEIGTVTPFSNNATICSWPTIEGGELPAGHSTASMDKAFVAANRSRQIDLPTAVGFCMYIRRDCLEDVGGFDEETFGRGYGEENDFCLRATEKGWRHILACDTFVYHAGETSFGKDSPERSRAWDLLTTRYPQYAAVVARHVEADAAAACRFAATAAMFRQSDLPVVLIVNHALGGGVDRHLSDLLTSVGPKAHFIQLQPHPHGFSASVPGIVGHPQGTFFVQEIDELVEVLKSFGLSRIHFHHWIAFSQSLRSVVDKLNLPFDVTIHDYYAICPRINLLPSPDSMYCGEPSEGICNSCIAQQPLNGARNITEWRTSHSWLLQEAERVICPSQDVASRIARHEPHARVIVVPHEPVTSDEWRVSCRNLGPGEPMRIGILGVVAPHKGRNLLAALIEEADPRKYRFTIIGYCDPQLPENLRRKVEETGEYKEADLPLLLREAKLHALWFPVIVPETYSYTLSAAIDAELPIIAPTIGAFPERLVGRPLSWLIEPTLDVPEMLKTFARVRDELLMREGLSTAKRSCDDESFYPTSYLEPLRSKTNKEIGTPKSLRRRGVTSVLVLPDRYDHGGITPCGYIRLVLPFDHAAETHSDLFVQVVDLESALSREADILVCQRHVTRDLASAELLIRHCRENDIKIVYDLDDDLINIPSSHPEAAYLQEKVPIVRRFATEADAVWVATPALKARLASMRPDAQVIRNKHDDRIWRPRKPEKPKRGQPVKIVYMGTATHDEELRFLTPIAEQLYALHGSDIRFEVVGVKSGELPDCFHRVSPDSGAGAETYPGFVEWFVRQSWDIGLSPLMDGPFNECKSAIKLIDYAAVALPIICSTHNEYQHAFSDNNGALLVKNESEVWVRNISTMITNPNQRATLAHAVHRHYSKRHVYSATPDFILASLEVHGLIPNGSV